MSVTLVGAGCGSPRLLTIAAADCIAAAQHIIYDRLIHPDILQLEWYRKAASQGIPAAQFKLGVEV